MTLLNSTVEQFKSHHDSLFELHEKVLYPDDDMDYNSSMVRILDIAAVVARIFASCLPRSYAMQAEVKAAMIARSRERDQMRTALTTHEGLSLQAATEFSCTRAAFHPEYLVVMYVLSYTWLGPSS